jgi:4-alpha-glucanotransferase
MTRHAGVLAPLFSVPSSHSWGIGELPDIGPLSAWLGDAGFDRLMLLPIGTMDADRTSPYSAASAMAIDPIFIALPAVEDFTHAGGIGMLSDAGRWYLADARSTDRVRYESVRRVKGEALAVAYTEFLRREWEQLTPRAADLAGYIARERWWLEEYALFEALAEQFRHVTWRDWPAGLRDRDPQALDDARRQHARRVLFHQYAQWIAEGQWQAARATALARGVVIFGDLAFAVDLHSADVWARAGEFLLDVSLGVPPDAFSETGQDWGLPMYRWDIIAAGDYAWIRQRARRMAALFAGFRVDHLVGFYRTYGRPRDADPFFIPPQEDAQIAQGEQILRIFLESGAAILAEDLGTVPDFVRDSLARLDVAGCKVLRWERDWHAPGQPFRDPATYPVRSVALSGTHDTETLAAWWENAPPADRRALVQLPPLRDRRVIDEAEPWDDLVRDELLGVLYASGSDELFLPIQDVFGWRDRINVPGTIGESNWTWRLPWPVDRLGDVPDALERAAFCRRLADASGRSPRGASRV